MIFMYALALLLLVGVVAIWRWGSIPVTTPWADEPPIYPSARQAFMRYVWYVSLVMSSSLAASAIAIAAGGRLAMRILAATAGPAAQGRLTEAEEVVGKITLDGTLGFMLFIGVIFGVASGGLYMLIRRWLPRGRWGGFAYGVLLIVVFGPVVDPLRPRNPDFDIVGPGWLSVLIFVVMAIFEGMLVAAIAGRISKSLPMPTRSVKGLAPHLPLLGVIATGPVAVGVLGVGLLSVAVSRWHLVVDAVRGRTAQIGGRMILIVGALVATPRFMSAIASIVWR